MTDCLPDTKMVEENTSTCDSEDVLKVEGEQTQPKMESVKEESYEEDKVPDLNVEIDVGKSQTQIM